MAGKRPSNSLEDAPLKKRTKLNEDSEENDDSEMEHIPDGIDASQIPLSPISSQDAPSSSKVIQAIDDGIIEKIMLVDFMCHKRLEVILDSNVNFILGQNGSGKSAIMTAIAVALGGKAMSTQRASSLKSFIRSNCNHSEIILSLRNRGMEAYKPNEYGKSITIVRQIKKDGGSSYKLKSSSGHIVATGKEEVTRILDHFNIQVDNPVSMLSQDTSRNFLHSNNPSAKYKLFMRGTHLEQIAHDYASAEEKQKLMQEEIKRKKSMLPVLKSKAKELEEEVQDIERLQNLEQKLQTLSKELAWSVVRQMEQRAIDADKVFQVEKDKLKKTEEKMVRLKGIQEKKKKDKDEAMILLQEGNEEAGNIEKHKDELQAKKRAIEKEIREAKGKIMNINRSMEAVRKEKKAFEDKLDEIRKQSHRDVAGERETHTKEIERLQQQLKELENKLTTASQDKMNKETELKAVSEDLRRNNIDIEQTQSQIKECDDLLTRLSSSKNNALSGFGRWMIDLVNTINRQQNQFRCLPKGPIGSFIKVKDQKWCNAIEVAIGFGNLSGFLIDNHQDERVFKSIVNQVLRNYPGKSHPSCTTSRFEGRLYDVGRNLPHSSYPTIMSMIEVADSDVMNMLVDMCNVECTLLIHDKTEARHIMNERTPRNAKAAYTIEGDQVLPNRYYSNKMKRPFGIIHASMEEGIAQQTQCKDELMRYLNELREKGNDVHKNSESIKHQLSGIKNYIHREHGRRNNIRTSIDNVKAKIDEIDSMDQEEDVATWEGEIQDLEGKLMELRQEMDGVKESIKEKAVVLTAQNDKLEDHDIKVQEIMSRIQEMRAKLKRTSDDFEKVVRMIHQYELRIRQTEGEISTLEDDVNHLHTQAVEKAKKTEDLFERVETDRTQSSIQKEIDRIEKILRSESGRRADQDKIRSDYLEAIDKFDATIDSIKKEKNSLKELKSSLKMRVIGYENLRMRTAHRARIYFQHFVRKRGYDGKLVFDIDKKKLEIIVQVDKHQATKNVRSLSGGERSFATVSFVMALWDAIDSPFRCLDEFDVFMDLINRRVSMQLMLEEATLNGSKQFIFFTPQDMSALGVKFQGNYKVLQLNAPDRTQQTLD